MKKSKSKLKNKSFSQHNNTVLHNSTLAERMNKSMKDHEKV